MLSRAESRRTRPSPLNLLWVQSAFIQHYFMSSWCLNDVPSRHCLLSPLTAVSMSYPILALRTEYVCYQPDPLDSKPRRHRHFARVQPQWRLWPCLDLATCLETAQKIQKLPRNITHSALTTTLYGDLAGSTVGGLHCWQMTSHHNLRPQPRRYVNLLPSQNNRVDVAGPGRADHRGRGLGCLGSQRRALPQRASPLVAGRGP